MGHLWCMDGYMFVFLSLECFLPGAYEQNPLWKYANTQRLCFVLPIKTLIGGLIWNPWEKLCFH